MSPPPGKKGEWVAKVPKPEAGWSAYFVELTYPERRKISAEVHYRRAGDTRYAAVSALPTETVNSRTKFVLECFCLGGGVSSPVDGSDHLNRIIDSRAVRAFPSALFNLVFPDDCRVCETSRKSLPYPGLPALFECSQTISGRVLLCRLPDPFPEFGSPR